MPDSNAALDRLRGELQTIKNNFALAQAGTALMADDDAKARIEKAVTALSNSSPDFDARWAYIIYVFNNDDLWKSATRSFRNATLRNCLKEMFERVKVYGSETNQMQAIKKAPWYQFLRIIRNCLSHDMRIKFNAHDRKLLPVSWSGLTISEAVHNQELMERDFFTVSKAQDLIEAVVESFSQPQRRGSGPPIRGS